MKFTFSWKDPEWEGAVRIPDAEYEKLHRLGLGEYIIVDVDTDAGTVTVREKPRKK